MPSFGQNQCSPDVSGTTCGAGAPLRSVLLKNWIFAGLGESPLSTAMVLLINVEPGSRWLDSLTSPMNVSLKTQNVRALRPSGPGSSSPVSGIE